MSSHVNYKQKDSVGAMTVKKLCRKLFKEFVGNDGWCYYIDEKVKYVLTIKIHMNYIYYATACVIEECVCAHSSIKHALCEIKFSTRYAVVSQFTEKNMICNCFFTILFSSILYVLGLIDKA